MKYEVDIHKDICYTVTVEAGSQEEALEKGYEMYEYLEDNNKLQDYYNDERVTLEVY